MKRRFRKDTETDSKMLRFDQMGRRMSIWVCLLVIGILLLGGTAILWYIWKQSMDAQKVLAEDAIMVAADKVDDLMKDIQRCSNAFCIQSGDLIDSAETNELLSQFLRSSKVISSIGILYNDGVVRPDKKYFSRMLYREDASHPILAAENSTVDYSSDSNWMFGLADSCWWSAVFFSEASHRHMVCYSCPLHRRADSSIYGVLCVCISTDDLEGYAMSVRPSSEMDLSIKHPNGMYVVRRNDSFYQQHQSYRSYEGVTSHGWTVLCNYSTEPLEHAIRHIIFVLLGAIIVTVVVLVVGEIIGVNHIARPYMAYVEEETARQVAMAHDLEVASNIQQQMLPHTFPPFPQRSDVDIFATLRTAREVGGDFYDYMMIRDKLYFCIGDVCGKGMPAALFMSQICGMFHTLCSYDKHASEVVERINERVAPNNSQCMFCTLFVGIINLESGLLEFCNAGHNTPILSHGGKSEWLAMEGDGIVGVFPDARFHTETMTLTPGDSLLLYTDGVTESESPDGQQYGDDLLLKNVSRTNTLDSKTQVEQILDTVSHHADSAEQSDDITLLCIRY